MVKFNQDIKNKTNPHQEHSKHKIKVPEAEKDCVYLSLDLTENWYDLSVRKEMTDKQELAPRIWRDLSEVQWAVIKWCLTKEYSGLIYSS